MKTWRIYVRKSRWVILLVQLTERLIVESQKKVDVCAEILGFEGELFDEGIWIHGVESNSRLKIQEIWRSTFRRGLIIAESTRRVIYHPLEGQRPCIRRDRMWKLETESLFQVKFSMLHKQLTIVSESVRRRTKWFFWRVSIRHCEGYKWHTGAIYETSNHYAVWWDLLVLVRSRVMKW